MPEYKLLIDGKRVPGESRIDIKSPFDGRTAAQVHFAARGQMEDAIEAAERAFGKTRRLSSDERFRILEKISREIDRRSEDLALSITLASGKPLKSSRIEVARAVNTFRVAAEESRRLGGEIIPLDLSPQTRGRWGLIRRFPLGVIAGITPFNFPLNLVAHKVAPALAAGNSFIARPASQVSPTLMILAEIIRETDYPAGGFNAVPCGYAAAEALVENPLVKMITFTGSPEIGWGLKQRAYKKVVTLELGGNAAVVIEPDTNLEFAVPRCVMGAFAYSGQVCISIQRILLHEEIYDRFMAEFIPRVKALRMGDPLDPETDIGPMINLAAAEQTEEWIGEAVENGATLACGGRRSGSMVPPTVLENVRPDLRISWLEAFAPVVVISRYRDFEQALQGVNHSIYGLQAGVFTRDLHKAFRAFEELEVGGVIVNDVPTFRIDHMPYGGVKESGFGREGLRYAIEEMTEMRLMAVNLES